MVTGRRLAPKGNDFWPTPSWATLALLDNETFDGEIWEPAAGAGHMAEVLIAANHQVVVSDKHDYGYAPTLDFFTAAYTTQNIITNPPFNVANQFVAHSLSLSRAKVALLLKLSFLEGITRYKTIYAITPPVRVWVFTERLTMYENGEQTGGTGTLAYAWFIWDKTQPKQDTVLKWLPPVYKNNLPRTMYRRKRPSRSHQLQTGFF